MRDKSTFLDSLNDAIDGVTRFFYPRRCPFCGVGLGRELICDSCGAALPRCDVQLRGAYYGVVSAPLWYTGGVRKALMDLKFRRRMGGLDLFGRLMGECAKRWYDGAFDAVTWVPVSGKRLRKRGFDQSRLLAASLCVDWHVMPQETLRKVVDNPPQSSLLGTERRRANVLGVYRPVRGHPGQALFAHRRFNDLRRHPGRVRPCAAGGRRRRRGVPDPGHHAPGMIFSQSVYNIPIWPICKHLKIVLQICHSVSIITI